MVKMVWRRRWRRWRRWQKQRQQQPLYVGTECQDRNTAHNLYICIRTRVWTRRGNAADRVSSHRSLATKASKHTRSLVHSRLGGHVRRISRLLQRPQCLEAVGRECSSSCWIYCGLLSGSHSQLAAFSAALSFPFLQSATALAACACHCPHPAPLLTTRT